MCAESQVLLICFFNNWYVVKVEIRANNIFSFSRELKSVSWFSSVKIKRHFFDWLAHSCLLITSVSSTTGNSTVSSKNSLTSFTIFDSERYKSLYVLLNVCCPTCWANTQKNSCKSYLSFSVTPLKINKNPNLKTNSKSKKSRTSSKPDQQKTSK